MNLGVGASLRDRAGGPADPSPQAVSAKGAHPLRGGYAGAEPKAPKACERRAARRALEDEVVAELERLGASAPLSFYVLTVVMGAPDISYAMIAQRVRRAKEKRAREAWQRTQKPVLKDRCLAAYELTCAYCDQRGTPEAGPDGEPWNLDRIRPGAWGGEYVPENVALACYTCNQEKGSNITFCPPPSLAEREAA